MTEQLHQVPPEEIAKVVKDLKDKKPSWEEVVDKLASLGHWDIQVQKLGIAQRHEPREVAK